MQSWLNYFEYNRVHRSPIPWEQGINLEPHLREPLIRSLQKFQIGESGEGRKLRQHAAETGAATYSGTIELFVKEEQEHARLMAEILRRLNAPLLTTDWTDNCFKSMRRLFGLHQELLVLLLPEMIAKCYFRALHDGTRDTVMRAVFAQILRDEEGHVAFHVEYLRRAFEKLSFAQRIAIQVIWRMVYWVTCMVVIFDHRDVLRACGVASTDFWRDCGHVFDETAAGIFSPASVLAPTAVLQLANHEAH
jgi:hypothetical protein